MVIPSLPHGARDGLAPFKWDAIVPPMSPELPAEDDVLFLHNPRCSKSRKVKELLDERGVSYTERRYLENPLSRAELEDLGRALDAPPAEWVRTTEAAFETLTTDAAPEDLYAAMVEQPILMQRPIVVKGARALIGRPPEAVLELF